MTEFVQGLSKEESRFIEDNVENQEVLAIYDLLKEGKTLNKAELKTVKEVAAKTLTELKAEKLKVEQWRASRQIKAQVRNTIYEQLLWLPQDSYSDADVDRKASNVYQHIYSNYSGGGASVYVG